jgi:hypothetical protein
MPTSLSKNDVFCKICLQRRVGHGIAAVFDDDGLAMKLADVGQRLRQNFGFVAWGNVERVRSWSVRQWSVSSDAKLCRMPAFAGKRAVQGCCEASGWSQEPYAAAGPEWRPDHQP